MVDALGDRPGPGVTDSSGMRSDRATMDAQGAGRTGHAQNSTDSGEDVLGPPGRVEDGGYHQRALRSSGSRSWVDLRARRRARAFRHDTAQEFADVVNASLEPGPDRVRAANTVLDVLIDYLEPKGERRNRVGGFDAHLKAIPPEERVPLVRRAINAVRRNIHEGILPDTSLSDVMRLARVSQGLGFNFDWDDNLAAMETQIVLFSKSGGEAISVSTDRFALIREALGGPGEFADYEVRTEKNGDHSFRNFSDDDDPEVFWNDLQRAMRDPNWRRASWSAFQKATALSQTAEWTTIITARAHYANTIHAALKRLVELGEIENVIPLGNIFPVSQRGLAEVQGGEAASPSEAKVQVMEHFLDRMEDAPFGPSAQRVVPPDGSRAKRYMHLWGFSDDDYGTFQKTIAELSRRVKEGRWPDIKITVFFTGQNHPDVEPHAVVLTADGRFRPRLDIEEDEVDRVFSQIEAYDRACRA